MTVENTKPVAVLAYTGPGRYDFDFLVYEDSDLSVSYVDVNGAVTLLERLIDYSVVKNVLPNEGGHIDTTAPLATTGFLDIRRSVPLTQPEEWSTEGYLKLDKLETSLDRLVMMVQQVSEVVDSGSATSNWRGDWSTGESYVVRDLVRAPNGNWYVAVSSHTSGVFVTDLAEGKWRIAIDIADIGGVNIPDPSTGRKGQAVVVNPTLDGYELGAGGGLSWSIKTANYTTSPGEGHLVDTSSASVTVTIHSAPGTGDTIAVGDLKGTFAINSCTIAMVGKTLHGVVQTADMVLDVKNQRVTLVYSGATDGWVITELEPNNSQFEYMPYAVMHVQDQKTQGTAGGTSTSGTQVRTLNTVTLNDIAGASLNANQITLPSGEYEIEARVPIFGSGGASITKARLYSITDSSYIAEGDSQFVASSQGGFSVLSVRLTLVTQKVIELRHYISVGGASNGLGAAASQGTEVYADLKITKIGGNYAPKPIISSARYQTVANLNTEGGIMGGDVTVSGNTLTVGKTSCLDATLAIPLSTTSDSTVVLPSTVNQDFYVFIVRLVAGGACTMKAYTTYAGPASDVLIDAFRFVSYAKNNGSGVTMPFRQVGDRIDWLTSNRPVLTASLTTSFASCSLSAILPIGSISRIEIVGTTSASTCYVSASYDGINTIKGGMDAENDILPVDSIYLKTNSATTPVHVSSITLRR